LALLKIVRTRNGMLNVDTFVDLAGYAGVAGEVAVAELESAGCSGRVTGWIAPATRRPCRLRCRL
jgi:hypothetical protein